MVETGKRWVPKKDFNPSGKKGKLHREVGVPEGEKIPAAKLESAKHSKDPEVKRDAVRADTMAHWDHGAARRKKLYGK